jgi:ribose transport system substrate-binding protein
MKYHSTGAARRALAVTGALLVTVGGLAACSTAGQSGTSDDASASPYLVKASDGPYKVGFSNSFAGNAFRTQMIYELEDAVARHSDEVSDLIVTDANNSVDKQISDINDLLTRGVDILLVEASSETALNSVLQRAWQQGVQVVTFDNVATSEHAIQVNISQEQFGQVGAEWLADQMGNKGSVFTLDGVAGSPVSEQRLDGATQTLKDAGIDVVAGAATDWDQAKGQAAALDLLSAHSDVTGIYSQGGGPSLGALNALQQRGADLIPITGEGYNGFLKEWKSLKDSQGWESIAPSDPPSLSADALDVALQALAGKDPGQKVEIDLPIITQDNLEDYVRPDLPDAFFVPTKLTEESIQKHYGSEG